MYKGNHRIHEYNATIKKSATHNWNKSASRCDAVAKRSFCFNKYRLTRIPFYFTWFLLISLLLSFNLVELFVCLLFFYSIFVFLFAVNATVLFPNHCIRLYFIIIAFFVNMKQYAGSIFLKFSTQNNRQKCFFFAFVAYTATLLDYYLSDVSMLQNCFSLHRIE